MSAYAGNASRTMAHRRTTLKPSACCGGVYLRASHPELAKVMAINHINAKDVATMMGLLKVARIATGYKEDNFVDLAGYAACAGEIAAAERGGGDHE